MSASLADIAALAENTGYTVYRGYAGTGARPPYVVVRPMLVDWGSLAVSGDAIGWDTQFGIYCVGGSVEASFNLAQAVIRETHAKRVGGSTLAATMSYSGALVEGAYESQVTIQTDQGEI